MIDCEHPYKYRTTRNDSGGNYGYYGYQRCLICGAEKDDWTDWHRPKSPWPAPDPADRQYVPMARIYICNMPDWAGDDYYEVGNTIPRHEGSFFG